jgi:hypothetical protein
VGEHSLPFAVRSGRVGPEPLEVRGHGDEPVANRIVDRGLIFVSVALPILSCLCQGAQLIVPVRFESVGDQAIARIDHHEAALCEIRVDLRPLDGSTPKLVGLVVSGFDLVADL